MNINDSKTLRCENFMNPNLKNQWDNIDWKEAEMRVNRLQIRIAKATKEKDWNLIKRLQYLLTHSFYAKAIAVKAVTGNKGKRTAGIDGEIWQSPTAKMKAVLSLTDKNYKAKPLKRIYIPKPGKKKKRPLSIPTMYDRSMQALYAMALSPVAETLADTTSFGFRKYRNTHDACTYAFLTLNGKSSAKWVLEADIKACFDTISHEWLIEHIPMDKSILKQFLKAGYIFNRNLFPTDRGAAQGGIISPILANMTLDGIEAMLAETFWKCPKGKINKRTCNTEKVNLTRYADDLIITAKSKETALKVKILLVKFLNKRGLELSEEKTKITNINNGFDFLGWTFRKFRGILLIKPSEESINRLNEKVGTIIHKAKAWKQVNLIQKINPILRGWANYHRHVVSKEVFSRQIHILWNQLYAWAKRRHHDKAKQWIKDKYWHRENGRDWIFKTEEIKLYDISSTPITRFIMVKLDKNPYLDREHFEQMKLFKNGRNNSFQTTIFQFPIFELPDTERV